MRSVRTLTASAASVTPVLAGAAGSADAATSAAPTRAVRVTTGPAVTRTSATPAGRTKARPTAGTTETATYSYDPFGTVTTAAGPQAARNPFRFVGAYYDSTTGLYHRDGRYYAPSTGRYTQPGPIRSSPASRPGSAPLPPGLASPAALLIYPDG
jgi:RHS repeat-associated protein